MWPRGLAHLPPPSAQRAARATETIRLAHACGLPELLKAAYYELLRAPAFGQDPAAYPDPYARVDAPCVEQGAEAEVVMGMGMGMETETEADEDAAPPARLTASDLVRLVAAKQALDKEWLALVRAPPLPSAIPCPLDAPAPAPAPAPDADADAPPTGGADGERRRCRAARAADAREGGWTARLLRNGVFEVGLEDVLEGVRRLVDGVDWRGMGYCVGCVGERRDAWLEARERMWAGLDGLLGLEEDGDGDGDEDEDG
ncbi:hypothetical protein C8Q78DRAFT_1152606 [Trametes maxima]|nr:hypothetical protein C8Q78DRAFT_1152606 [Trametes maxima]